MRRLHCPPIDCSALDRDEQHTHRNSIRSWYDTQSKAGTMRRQIVEALASADGPLSDRQIAKLIGALGSGPDAVLAAGLVTVRARVTELLQAGILIEAGDGWCQITRRRCRTVRLATQAEYEEWSRRLALRQAAQGVEDEGEPIYVVGHAFTNLDQARAAFRRAQQADPDIDLLEIIPQPLNQFYSGEAA